MVSRVNHDRFLRLARYLAQFSKKTRLRLIDHTVVTLAAIYLLYLTLASGLTAAKIAPITMLQVAPLFFYYDILVILLALVTCEYVIRKLIV